MLSNQLNHILSHCATCGKFLKENEGINGGVVYPQVWCNEFCKEIWLLNRRNQFI
jgi:predicted nucleic acid-binding Zn ribbon protein